MIRTVAILGLVAYASAFFDISGFITNKLPTSEKGFKVRFSANPITYMKGESFMDLPQTKDSAAEQGWVQTTRPDDGRKEFSSLELWIRKGDPALGLLFDDTGYIMGIQVAIPIERFTKPIYDWESQGFIYWIPEDPGTCGQHFWTTQVYFCSPESLLNSKAYRIAAHDDKKIIQGGNLYAYGTDGEILAIPTNEKELADTTTSNFTLQACVPLMGCHYYYNMTEQLECNAKQLLPFFPLMCKGQLIGLGIIIFGKLSPKDGCPDHFEAPARYAVKAIVPRGPECLYGLADSPGLTTMHIYFTKNPLGLVLCE